MSGVGATRGGHVCLTRTCRERWTEWQVTGRRRWRMAPGGTALYSLRRQRASGAQDRPGAVRQRAEDRGAQRRAGRGCAPCQGGAPRRGRPRPRAGRPARVSAIRVSAAGHPVRDDAGRLAVRRVPRGALGRVALADLLVGQALPVAAEPLAQVLVEDDRSGRSAGPAGAAVCWARVRSEENRRVRPQGGKAPAACSACASPVSSRGMSVWPWNRCSAFQVVWPCRHSTSRLAALSVRLRSLPGLPMWAVPRAAG